jgi:hypothetical protein
MKVGQPGNLDFVASSIQVVVASLVAFAVDTFAVRQVEGNLSGYLNLRILIS